MAGEFYRPQPMAANTAYKVAGIHIGGFLATIAGTLTVTAQDGTVLLNALPVAVGFNRLAILLPQSDGAMVQLAGGAAGSLLI
jgi:ABC-type uncharacterized transport system permease subunit